MQTIFVATDSDGECYLYCAGKPNWDGKDFGIGYGDKFSRYHGPDKTPPGECRECRLVPADGTDEAAQIASLRIKLENSEIYGKAMADDNRGLRERIAELEKQLAERSPGVMPECVSDLLTACRFLEAIEKETGQRNGGALVRLDADKVREYYAPPEGYEWQPVDAEHPITAADVGRKVQHRNGGVDKVGKVKDVPDVYRLIVGEHAYAVSGRVWCGKKSTADITHILRPIATPFVFDGEPGRHQVEYGYNALEDVDVVRAEDALWVRVRGHWHEVNSDGTFAGGRITGRVNE